MTNARSVTLVAFAALLPLAVSHAQDAASSAPAATTTAAQPSTTPLDATTGVAPSAAGDDKLAGMLKNPDWTIQIEPAIWFVSPSGKFALPADTFTTQGDKIKIKELNLDAPLISPYGELNVRADPWRFTFSAGDYSSDRTATAESNFRLGDMVALAGDPLGVSFDFFTAEASLGYRVYQYDFRAHSEHPENATRALLSTYVLGGVRMYDVDISVDNRAAGRIEESGTHQFFAEPIIGVRNEIELAGDFTIDQQLSFGALPIDKHSSYSVDIALGFMYRPQENVGVQIGWRQVAFWLADGEDGEAEEFEYNGRLAGLYCGVTFRF